MKLSREFMRLNCIEAEEYLEVQIVGFPVTAQSRVEFECESMEAYQAISLNRQLLENSLLNQVSVVSPGCSVPIHVGVSQHYVLKVKLSAEVRPLKLSTDTELVILDSFPQPSQPEVPALPSKQHYLIRRISSHRNSLLEANRVLLVSPDTLKRLASDPHFSLEADEFCTCIVKDALLKTESEKVLQVSPGLADDILFSFAAADATVQVSKLERRRFPKTPKHYFPFTHSSANLRLTHLACKLTVDALKRGVRWFVGPVAAVVPFCAEFGVALKTDQMCRGMYEACRDCLVVDLGHFLESGWFDQEAKDSEFPESWEELVSRHLQLDASASRVCLKTADSRESRLLIDILKNHQLVALGRDHFSVDFERLLDMKQKSIRDKLRDLFVELQLRPRDTKLTVFFANFHLLFQEQANQQEKEAHFFVRCKMQRFVDLCEDRFCDCSFFVDSQVFYSDSQVFKGRQFATLEVADLKAKLLDRFLAFCLRDFPHLSHLLDKVSFAEMAHAWNLEFELRKKNQVQQSDRLHIEQFIAGIEKKKDQAGQGVTLDEVIGMAATKAAIKKTIENRLRFEALYRELPIKVSTSRPG